MTRIIGTSGIGRSPFSALADEMNRRSVADAKRLRRASSLPKPTAGPRTAR